MCRLLIRRAAKNYDGSNDICIVKAKGIQIGRHVNNGDKGRLDSSASILQRNEKLVINMISCFISLESFNSKLANIASNPIYSRHANYQSSQLIATSLSAAPIAPAWPFGPTKASLQA
jgi:hypothetical protein